MTRTIALLFAASTFIATGCNEHPLEGVEYDNETGYGEGGSGGDIDEDEMDEDGDGGNDSGGNDSGGNVDLTTFTCGDGTVDRGEQCDFGVANDDGGECTGECRYAECGDGLVWEGEEECDHADLNGEYDPAGYCSDSCEWVDL